MNPQPNLPQLSPRRSLWARGGRGLILLLLTLGGGWSAGCAESDSQGAGARELSWELSWGEMPSLPAPRSGQMVGVSEGALLSIGGTDFPVPLFAGGRKVWYGEVLALRPGRTAWEAVGQLDHPLAYGGSVTTADGVITIGGADAERHYATVSRWRLQPEGDARRIGRTDLPSRRRAPRRLREGSTRRLCQGPSGGSGHSIWRAQRPAGPSTSRGRVLGGSCPY